MKLDFTRYSVTVVVCPVDLRKGYEGLAQIATSWLGVNLQAGPQLVVFISRSCNVVKMIAWDEYGSTTITRKLHAGRFQRLLMAADAPASRSLTMQLLERYLDGKPIDVKRTNLTRN